MAPLPITPSPFLVETCQCWKCAYRWGKLRPKLMESLYLKYSQFPVSGLSLV